MARPALADLPEEIICSITNLLQDDDICALHIVNKDLYIKTKYPFGKRFFTCISVFLHPVSFGRLLYVANDAAYARIVEKVTISSHVFWQRRQDPSQDPVVSKWAQRAGTEQKREFERHLHVEADFIHGDAVTGLVDTIEHLPKLTTFKISDFPSGEEHFEDTKLWGREESDRAKGCSIVEEQSWNPIPEQEDRATAWTLRQQIFEVVVAAITRSNLLARGIHFDIDFVSIDKRMWIGDDSDWHSAVAPSTHNVRGAFDLTKPLSPSLLRSISPEMLSLAYMHWPDSKTAFNLQLSHYPRLRVLRLSHACIFHSQLNTFLLEHSTLEVLEFTFIYLWWPFPGSRRFDTTPSHFPWVPIWETILDLPNLHSLRLHRIAAAPQVRFLGRPSANLKQPWRGKEEIKTGLQVLLALYRDDRLSATLCRNPRNLWVWMKAANNPVERLRESAVSCGEAVREGIGAAVTRPFTI